MIDVVRFAINMVGNRELGAKINRIIKKIDTEPTKTINRMAYEAQLYAMMIAPRRTGATANSIKTRGTKNFREIYVNPIVVRGFPYNTSIDAGKVSRRWGTRKLPPTTDMRDRKEKLHYFVGTDAVEGKTLMFVKKNFGRHVNELGKSIAIS